MRKARGSMTRRTGGVSRIAIKEPRSGSTEVPMRKPLRLGRRFAAGRRVVGKSSRVAEQTGSGKGVRASALGPATAKAALPNVGSGVAAKVGKRVRASGLVPATAKVGKGVRASVLGPAATKVGKRVRASALGPAAAKPVLETAGG